MNPFKKILLIMAISSSSVACSAQSDIQLVAPSTTGGLTIMEALWSRHSDREFAERKLSDQDLSDLFFAASGINRPGEGKITSPSALNTQEIDIYLFNNDGVFKYSSKNHKLNVVKEGDYRNLLAGTPQFSQDFVLQAPVNLVLVANVGKFEKADERARSMATADAGIMSENICLFCAGKGLATVPRATMDSQAISELLKLPAESFPVLNLPVGYPK